MKDKKDRRGKNSFGYQVIRFFFLRPVRLLFRVRSVNEEKLPKEGGYIICANHTAMLDVLILSVCNDRQIRYMAKAELFKIPLLRGLITFLGAYPVDRGGADVKSIRRTISLIDEGYAIGIFPQGTRHPGVDPSTTPIKGGVGMIAYHAKAPIVPAYIRTKGNRVMLFRKTELVIGDPIPYEELGFEKGGSKEYKAATEKVFTKICALGGYTRTQPADAAPAAEEDVE